MPIIGHFADTYAHGQFHFGLRIEFDAPYRAVALHVAFGRKTHTFFVEFGA